MEATVYQSNIKKKYIFHKSIDLVTSNILNNNNNSNNDNKPTKVNTVIQRDLRIRV